MTAGRRVVRATPQFFQRIDQLLPADRDGRDVPTRAEFEAYDLLPIVDRVGDAFDSLPTLYPDRRDVRVLIVTGRLVAMIAVLVRLADDGAVELIGLELDLDARWRGVQR